MSEEKNKTQRVTFKMDSNGKVFHENDENGRWLMTEPPERSKHDMVAGIDTSSTTTSGHVCIYTRNHNGLISATMKPFKVTRFTWINNLYLRIIRKFIKLGFYD